MFDCAAKTNCSEIVNIALNFSLEIQSFYV